MNRLIDRASTIEPGETDGAGKSGTARGRTSPPTNDRPRPTSTPIVPPSPGEHRRLQQELLQDRPAGGADGLADADLAGPLGHRNQHDVGDPDPADDQRDAGDRAGEQGQEGELRRLVDEVLLGAGVEVALGGVGDPVAVVEHGVDLLERRGHGAPLTAVTMIELTLSLPPRT